MNMGNTKTTAVYTLVLALICLFMLLGYFGDLPDHSQVYVNEEYGFELEYPGSWTVANASDATRREELAKADTADPENVSTIDHEVVSVANMVHGRNRGRLSVRYCALSPLEYLDQSLRFMSEGLNTPEIKILEREEDYEIAGRSFCKARMNIDFGEVVVRSEVYVTAVDGGSLMFGLTAVELENLENLRQVFGALRFQ